MHRKIIISVIISTIILSACLCHGAEEKVHLLFIAPTFSVTGLGVTVDGLKQIGEQMIKVVEKKTGLVFEYEMVGSPTDNINDALDKTIERLKTGGDFSWLDYEHYLGAREQKIPVNPAAVLTIGGKLTQKMCMYVKKGSQFKTLKDLRGARVTGGYLLDWISQRALLYVNKIDERPDKFFGELVPVATYFASFQGVILGGVDTFIMSETVYNVVKTFNPNFVNVVPLVCADTVPNGLFPVYRETVPPGVVKKFKSILYNAPTDPDMGMISPILKSTGIIFVEATPDIMKKMGDAYALYKKRGWIQEAKEYDAVMKSHQRLKEELKKCRKECNKKKSEDEKKICIDLCAQKNK